MTAIAVVKPAKMVAGGKVKATGVSLDLPDGLSFEEWAAVGGELGRVGRAVAWIVGDWLNYGFWEYGKRYEDALELTGFDYGTLRNWKWVAEKVDVSLRNNTLSWYHHQAVAPLEPGDQERWLAAAASEGWGYRDLREKIAAARGIAPPAPSFRFSLVLPSSEQERAERWRHAAEQAGQEWADWAAGVLDWACTRTHERAYVEIPAGEAA